GDELHGPRDLLDVPRALDPPPDVALTGHALPLPAAEAAGRRSSIRLVDQTTAPPARLRVGTGPRKPNRRRAIVRRDGFDQPHRSQLRVPLPHGDAERPHALNDSR